MGEKGIQRTFLPLASGVVGYVIAATVDYAKAAHDPHRMADAPSNKANGTLPVGRGSK